MAVESQVGSSHDAKDTTVGFIEKVLEKMEDMEAFWTKKMELIERDQEANLKMMEELEELQTQHECTEEARDRELKSYDGTRSAKTLGNILWDMEQYLERLGLSDDETKVKVAAQFLTKDAKMCWQRRMDQIANGSAGDITSWDEMKKYLQTHFSP
eukprot:PITA_33370